MLKIMRPARAEGRLEHQAVICTLPEDPAELGPRHPLPLTQPVRAGSPSYGTWAPNGKLLACTQFERTGILGSSLTATAVLVRIMPCVKMQVVATNKV